MADVAQGQGEPVPEKTEEQLAEEQKQREEEQKQKQQERRQQEEQRKRLEEQARIKKQQDMKKLEEAMKGTLRVVAKNSNNKTMVYVKLNLAEKQLERIFPSILTYNQIQHLDLNTNTLTDISLVADFPFLLTLNVSKNQIGDLSAFACEEKLLNLQILNVSTNKINQMTQIALPSLKKLNLSENQINKADDWKGHAHLQILELQKNKFRKLKGLVNMKNLKELYVEENQLTDIRGLQNIPNLTKLSVKTNKLKCFMNPFPFLPCLEYINLNQNQFENLKQFEKMDQHIKSIDLLQNPISDSLGDNFKKQMIWAFPRFTKINESPVTEEDRIGFEKERLEKIAQQEKQRLEREQEAKKAAEQEEAS